MDTTFREDVKEQLDDVLLGIPGVSGGKAFGFPAYKVGRKVFCFVGGNGIGIKLPEEKVSQLIESNDGMNPYVPETGTVWKSWVSIELGNAEDYAEYRALYEESAQFVGNGA
ncbi:MmcQ/YjbR family DNA-binding protein [Phototrophicus methaneseepsis]|uniref:MmcQ/YjbR family DNA-binding protein n=1 Tax=Phototrophicus methaneseepsis TaxID=2710758 RepID=A0A7S8ECN4_9CHLR|nr:MmcQ/YjbR family DNA-binding protein [Phototrophicus methaneseepsis]QPC84409.1 MmcQ/YjbR family DNA-binding protein [Phototrophicus methaneseepsis]